MVRQHVHARFQSSKPKLWFPKPSVYHTLLFYPYFPTQTLHRAQLARSFILKFKLTSAPVCSIHFCCCLLFMFDFGYSLSWHRVWWAGINKDMIARSGGSQWVGMPSISIEMSDSQQNGCYVLTLHATEYYPKCQFNFGAAMNDSLAQNLYFMQHWSHTSVY